MCGTTGKGWDLMGAETQVFGSLAFLLVVLAALGFLLFLVPIPLWIAAWASNAYVVKSADLSELKLTIKEILDY